MATVWHLGRWIRRASAMTTLTINLCGCRSTSTSWGYAWRHNAKDDPLGDGHRDSVDPRRAGQCPPRTIRGVRKEETGRRTAASLHTSNARRQAGGAIATPCTKRRGAAAVAPQVARASQANCIRKSLGAARSALAPQRLHRAPRSLLFPMIMPKPNAGPSIAVLMRVMFIIAAVAAAMLIDLRAS
jgi:hypothetical protein